LPHNNPKKSPTPCAKRYISADSTSRPAQLADNPRNKMAECALPTRLRCGPRERGRRPAASRQLFIELHRNRGRDESLCEDGVQVDVDLSEVDTYNDRIWQNLAPTLL
jgi:hypothetical protein